MWTFTEVPNWVAIDTMNRGIIRSQQLHHLHLIFEIFRHPLPFVNDPPSEDAAVEIDRTAMAMPSSQTR